MNRIYIDGFTGKPLLLNIPIPEVQQIIQTVGGSSGGSGSGDVVGPASSTDNAIARFDGATGKLLQDSGITIDDSNNLTIPSLTAGSVLFAGTDGVISQDNANFFWNDSTNRLGIGTASPGASLDIRGSAIFNEDGGDFDFRIESDTNANILFVDASINGIGLGTTPTVNIPLNILLTASPVSGVGRIMSLGGTVNAVAGQNAYGVTFGADATLKEAGSDTHSVFANVFIDAPTITAGAATLTNAASLYIPTAPTGGTNNYAAFIDAGTVRMDGTLQLGLAGTVTGVMNFQGSTSGVVTIQPANAAGTYTLTLPTDDGTASQFLQTDGAGVLSWATPAGSGDVTKVGTPVDNQIGVWTGNGTIEGDADFLWNGTTLTSTNPTDNASVQIAILQGDRATMADNDEAYITLRLSDDGGTQTEVARLTWVATDVNDATGEDGRIDFAVMTAGTLADEMQLDGISLAPSTSDGLALGTASLMWADLFLASGSVINFNNGDVTITHSANALDIDGGIVDFGSTPTVNTAAVYFAGGTDVALADGGTGTSLTDPNADAMMTWDDSAGAVVFMQVGNGLNINATPTLAADTASATVDGVVELATAAETTTGTDATRAVTPDGLSGSIFGQRTVEILVSDPNGDAITTGDGKAYFKVPSDMAGMDLVTVSGHVTTASSSGVPTIQIRNSTQLADMLSTRITIDANEIDSDTAATAPVIDTANDDVANGDIIFIDIDVAGTGTKGLLIEMTFQLP